MQHLYNTTLAVFAASILYLGVVGPVLLVLVVPGLYIPALLIGAITMIASIVVLTIIFCFAKEIDF